MASAAAPADAEGIVSSGIVSAGIVSDMGAASGTVASCARPADDASMRSPAAAAEAAALVLTVATFRITPFPRSAPDPLRGFAPAFVAKESG
jgi:hypothetical protein